jgi:hypothetical protein
MCRRVMSPSASVTMLTPANVRRLTDHETWPSPTVEARFAVGAGGYRSVVTTANRWALSTAARHSNDSDGERRNADRQRFPWATGTAYVCRASGCHTVSGVLVPLLSAPVPVHDVARLSATHPECLVGARQCVSPGQDFR